MTGIATIDTSRFGSTISIISDLQGAPYCCGFVIYCSSGELSLMQGQCVRIVGTVIDFYDRLELDYDPSMPAEIWDCGFSLPAPAVFPDCNPTEAYENCPVILECVTAEADPDEHGNQPVIDKYFCEWAVQFPRSVEPLEIGQEVCSIQGILQYNWGEPAIRIRGADDVDYRDHEHCPFCDTTPPPVPTETPTQTPTPTPTIEPCGETGVSIVMPRTHFHAGDLCYCYADICNAESSELNGYPLFILLDVYGTFLFGPEFTTEPSYYDVPVFPKGKTRVFVIPEFPWPPDAGSAHGITWIGALTNPSVTELIGTPGYFTFAWD